jgi:hypothetical protein
MKLPILLTLFPLALGAVPVDLDFTIVNTVFKPSTATDTYQIGTNLNDPSTFVSYTTTVPYSGTLEATADVNISTGNVNSITFTGGSISTPNISTLLKPKVYLVEYNASLSTSGVTRSPRGAIVPNVGIYYTVFTAGSFTAYNYTTFYGPSVDPVAVNRQLAIEPEYLIGPNIIATATFEFDETDSTALGTSYTANLHSLINLPAAPYGIRASRTNNFFKHKYGEFGDLYADASYTVPTPYGQWALVNNLELTTGEEVNEAGMPYALLYAFKLPADAASLPLTFSSTPEPTVELDLPITGLGFTVQVEYSADPSTAFSPLPDENFLDGTDSLDAGKIIDATLSYPAGEQGFLRFYVDLDPEP